MLYQPETHEKSGLWASTRYSQVAEETNMADFLDFLTASYIGIFLLVVNIITGVHILLTKNEEPTSAVLWLVVVFTFPVLGLLLYLFFGINRLKTRGIRIHEASKRVKTGREESMKKALVRHMNEQREHVQSNAPDYPLYSHTLDRLIPETLPLTGNRIELLKDGTKAYPRMIEEIRGARSAIHLQSYIIGNDPIGKEILEALEQKAAEGIDIRIIYDRFGSMGAFMSFLFSRYGARLPNFRAYSFGMLIRAPWTIQLRNHRKLMLVDGHRAFIGGINIGSENDIRHSRKDHYTHDLHCFINGPAVGELQFSFLRDWHVVSGDTPENLFREEYFPRIGKQGDSIVRVSPSGPGQNYEATEKVFMTAASTAKKSLWLITPYFVPSKPFWQALIMAAARGVDVRLVLPEKNNHWYVHFASQSLYQRMLSEGIRIFQKSGSFSHAKAMIIDREWSVMGSSNCDVRSFRLNYELDIVVEGGDFIDILHAQFMEEIQGSTEVNLRDISRKSMFRQVLENGCSLLTPIL